MGFGAAGEQAESQFATGFPAEHLSEYGGSLVVADDEKVARMGIERNTSMAEVRVHHAGLVCLVVVDPQLDGGLRSVHWLNRTVAGSSVRLVACVRDGLGEAASQRAEPLRIGLG